LVSVHLQHLKLLHVQRFLFPCPQSLHLLLMIFISSFERAFQKFFFLLGGDFGPMTFVILALVLNPFVSYFSQPITLVLLICKYIVHKIIVLRSHTAGLGSHHPCQAEFHIGFQTYSIFTFVLSIWACSRCFWTSSLENGREINRRVLSIFFKKVLFLFSLYSDRTVKVFLSKTLTLLEHFPTLLVFFYFLVLGNFYQTSCILLKLLFVLELCFFLHMALLSSIKIYSFQLKFFITFLSFRLFAQFLVFLNIGQNMLVINFLFVGNRYFLILDLRIQQLSQVFLIAFFL